MQSTFKSVQYHELNDQSVVSHRRHSSIFLLGLGIVVGYTLASIFWIYSPTPTQPRIEVHHSHDTLESAVGPSEHVGEHASHEAAHQHENKTVKDQLHDEVKILCWIMTTPANHKSKTQHVVKTWGKRCNKLLLMSTQKDDTLDVVVLPVGEGRDNLWAKTKQAFLYIYKHHLNDADWFMKADDDTYVIVENLRYMLYPYPPQYPIYFGHRFKPYLTQGYMSGGAGYVLSKEAVKRFVEKAMTNSSICSVGDAGAEDVEIGKCLQNVEVKAADSRDAEKRGRFFPFQPEAHLIPGQLPMDMWFWDYEYYKPGNGFDCCSDNAISFHYESPNAMYVMDYLIYHLRPYGIVQHSQPLPKKMTIEETNALMKLEMQEPVFDKKSLKIEKKL